jgi:hypothetical protein
VDLAGITSVDAHEVTDIAWGDCLAATWEPPLLTVTTHIAGQSRRYAWQLSDPQRVPEVVHDRVSSVVIVDVRRDYGEHGVVRLVARRTADGAEWLTLADDPTWADSDVGRRSIAADLAELQANLGV